MAERWHTCLKDCPGPLMPCTLSLWHLPCYAPYCRLGSWDAPLLKMWFYIHFSAMYISAVTCILTEGWKTPMNCYGDETWNEVSLVTKLFLKGHITLGKQEAPVKDLKRPRHRPFHQGQVLFQFLSTFFFFSFLTMPKGKGFKDFDSSSGCATSKTWGSGIWGPWRGVRKWAAAFPLWLCIDPASKVTSHVTLDKSLYLFLGFLACKGRGQTRWFLRSYKQYFSLSPTTLSLEGQRASPVN